MSSIYIPFFWDFLILQSPTAKIYATMDFDYVVHARQSFNSIVDVA